MAADRFVDRTEIAFLLGVEPRTVTNYVKSHPDFPSRVKGSNRTFPVQRCLAWQRDRAVADAITSVAPPPPDGAHEAGVRKAIADAELAEIRLAKLRGELIPVDVASQEVDRAFGRVRARFVAVPGEYGPQLLNLTDLPRAVAVLRALVAQVLTELQVGLGDGDADDDEGDAPSDAPPDVDAAA